MRGTAPSAPGADAEPAAAESRHPGAPVHAKELAARLHVEHHTLEGELSEIELLVQQARAEAARHESKRAAAADRFAKLSPKATGTDVVEASKQLVTVTRRAGVMQAQVDVLEGKLKVLQRFRDASAQVAADLDWLATDEAATRAATGAWGVRSLTRGRGAVDDDDGDDPADMMPPALSRIVLGAQEDLRREIARTMHDGPAQSLTNIVLQAQIVDRLVGRDPESAVGEVRQLISMVQQTLDATKSFIFDVRPMVLDDLGLVPTMRRASRERGRRAQIPVEFESFGSDRRMPMELESGLFRILDETLAAYLAGRPDRVTIRLDWMEGLEARVIAHHPQAPGPEAAAPSAAAAATDARADTERNRGRGKRDALPTEAMPAALAAMIEERRKANTVARRSVGGLPPATRREIRQRASTLDILLELTDDSRDLRLVVEASTDTE